MTPKPWHYDELKQIGVDYADVEEVERYDARMQRLRDIPVEIGHLVEATSPTEGCAALEIGTGTGEFAMAMAGRVRRVCAVDVSPVMLEYAGRKARLRGIENVEFHHAGFLSLDPSLGPFDIAFTQLALHHLPDFWKAEALKNIHGVLKAGGRFFLKDVVYPSGLADYDAFFAGVIGGLEEAAGPEFTREIVEHIRKEYSTLDWIMEDLLRRAGFRIMSARMDRGFIASYACRKETQDP